MSRICTVYVTTGRDVTVTRADRPLIVIYSPETNRR